MSEQRFSLRWNNYQTHLISAFENLFNGKDFVDVTLGCGGKKVEAHRMLLSACSPYFHDLLKDNPCQHPIIILRDIEYEDLTSLLQFIYNGEVNLSETQLNSFLKTGESLKIQGLTDLNPEKSRGGLVFGVKESKLQRKHSKNPDLTEFKLAKQQRLKRESPSASEDEGSEKREKCVKVEVVKDEHQSGDNVSANSIEECYIDDSDIVYSQDGYSGHEYSIDNSDQQIDSLHDESGNENGTEQDASHGSSWERADLHCDICFREFSNYSTKKQHMAMHTGASTCPICGTIFSTKGSMNRHLKTWHYLAQ